MCGKGIGYCTFRLNHSPRYVCILLQTSAFRVYNLPSIIETSPPMWIEHSKNHFLRCFILSPLKLFSAEFCVGHSSKCCLLILILRYPEGWTEYLLSLWQSFQSRPPATPIIWDSWSTFRRRHISRHLLFRAPNYQLTYPGWRSSLALDWQLLHRLT